jgi:hypothetical protein
MTALMTKLVEAGRSTPGTALPNDVPVNWKRHLEPAGKAAGGPRSM